MRSDGTLWYQGINEVMLASGPAVTAVSYDTYWTADPTATTGSGLGCAVDSAGAVWCWGSNNYGQLGIGSTSTGSGSAVQVATTAVGTTYLTGMKKVWVDGYNGEAACAINGSGSVWCWGYGNYGELGNGSTFNYPYAKPVLTAAGSSQLTGVDQMSVAEDHTCAHKTDNTVWCWGSNSEGQIGVGTSSSSNPSYLYPVQVTSLMNQALQVSVGQNVSCAVDSANDVWCWGYNYYGQIGQGSTSTTTYTSPQQVLTAAGGSALSGVSKVVVGAYYSDSVCAMKSADGSLWCWGSYSSGMTPAYAPAQYAENSTPVDTVAYFGDAWNNNPSFIDYKGQFHFGGYESSSNQVTCP
jgi:alpha-tubulin suppressor-like RCC1 family protein